MNVVSPIAAEINKTMTKAVIAKVLAASGLLAIPFFGPIASVFVTGVVDMFVTWLLGETVIGGATIWVQANVDWDVKDVNQATAELQKVLNSPEDFLSAQQAQIESEFDQDAVNLIHIVNARLTS